MPLKVNTCTDDWSYSFVGIKHNQSTNHLFRITLLWFYEHFDIFVTFTTAKVGPSQDNHKKQSI